MMVDSVYERTGRISIVAISGSLRRNSSNTFILQIVSQLAPAEVRIKIVEGLDNLPHFNPDLNNPGEAVATFRQQLKDADGILICTPEYAFGVPGVLKNSLDWVVSSGELNEKPVAAISASPLPSGGDKALASLLLTLRALGTLTNAESTLSIGGIKKKIREDGEIMDLQTKEELKSILKNLITTIGRNNHKIA